MLSLQQRSDALCKLVLRINDRAARTDQGRWPGRPGSCRAKEQVGIPVARLIVRLIRDKPISQVILWIPQVDHTRVGKSSAIPLVPRIEGEFDGPNDIDTQPGTAIFL